MLPSSLFSSDPGNDWEQHRAALRSQALWLFHWSTSTFLPCIPHKADLKAAPAVMRSSEGRGPQSFGLACGLVQGAVVYSQKKFVFIFEFFKLRVQSASLVIVLWFCSKSCFLMHFKSSHRSFSHGGWRWGAGSGLAEDWENCSGLPFLLTACHTCNYSPLFLGG